MAAAILLQDRAIYEQLCKDYLNLKTVACGVCYASPDAVRGCKDALKLDVCSARKLDAIQRLEELLALLERRNLLSMIKVELLAKLEPTIGDAEFASRLVKFRVLLEQYFWSVRRFYLEDLRHRDRRTLLEREIEQVKLVNAEPTVLESKPVREAQPSAASLCNRNHNYSRCRQDIFDLLVREISREWNTLGRNLQLSTATLYAIEDRHPKDVKARIGEVLEEAEKEQGERFVELLGEALVNARRKDLKRKLDKLLS